MGESELTSKFGGYVCDTDLMVSSILSARAEMYTSTARWPCSLLVHRDDVKALRKAIDWAADLPWDVPMTDIRLLGMRVVWEPHVRGHALLTVCDNCLYGFNLPCQYGKQSEAA